MLFHFFIVIQSFNSSLLSATKPESEEAQAIGNIKHNFKTLPDGRLLIAEMEEEEEKTKGKKNQGGKARGGGDDDLEDMMDDEMAKVCESLV